MDYWRDKVAVVTGGSSGLGRAIASALAGAGARVVIAARGVDKLERAAAEMRAAGGNVVGIACDVKEQEDVDRLFAQTIQDFGRLDLLVNNAGRSDRGEVLATTPEKFREWLELNFIALVRCTRAAAPHLLKTGGHLVNIGSLAGKSASRYVGAYPATKFAVAAYTQQLRLELGPLGLHVLLVSSGPIAQERAIPYSAEELAELPESAKKPGAGVKVKALSAERLAQDILHACKHRQSELVRPSKARLLFALSQLSPGLGDWLVRRMTS